MLNPALIRLLQAQSPEFFKRSQPLDPELEQRRNFALPTNQPPPVPTAQNPQATPYAMGGAPVQHRLDYMDQQGMAMDRNIAATPPPTPKEEQGYFQKLLNDPTRMALLRYGTGVLGGQQPGAAMDSAMKTRAGIMSPGDPFTLGEGQSRYSPTGELIVKGPSGHPLSGLTKLDQKDYLAESWRAAMRSDGTIDRSKLVPFRTGVTGKTPKIGDVREIKSSGKIITQEFDGEDWVDYTSTPQWNPKQGPLATASSSVVNKTGKKLGEELAKAVVENQGKMQAYKENLNYMNESEKILDSGVITGVGAEWITSLGNVLQERLGIDTGDAVSNTEAFAASMANQAIAVMGSGKLGGGTGLSDKDLEFAKKMAASEISISEKALRRIMNINRKAMRYAIKEHNRKAGSVSKWAKRNKVDLPYGVEVDMSDYKPYQKPPPKPILVEDAEAEDVDEELRRRGIIK